MCVVSMVTKQTIDDWGKRLPPKAPPWIQPVPLTQEEVDEFHDGLKRAREYDKRMGQPDCETEEKKNELLKIAEELGVRITFDAE